MAEGIRTEPSLTRVRVEIDGTTVADSTRALLLFEAGLPTRYYFPPADVRLDLLSPTDHSTLCPHKGTARYWSAVVDGRTHGNIAWAYDDPTAGSAEIAGLVAFYNERTDIYLDEDLK